MMSEMKASFSNTPGSQIYEIRVQAFLDQAMAEWLGDFSICYKGEAETVLTGILPDQSALFGLLLRLHSLGIPLISVNPLPQDTGHLFGRSETPVEEKRK